MSATLFYFFAALMLGSAMFVVLSAHPIYSVVALVFSLLNLAALYFLLEATFLGILQILVYAGAIMVLFLFIIMLLSTQPDEKAKGPANLGRWWQMAALFGLVVVLGIVALQPELATPSAVEQTGMGDIAPIGQALFSTYLLPFEVASLLLTVALVGTVFLAKRKI